MDFVPTADHEELRRVVRSLLTSRSSDADVRRAIATSEGFDRVVWRQLADIGLQAMAIPEALSGAGYTLQEVGVVLEEMGRALLCAPYFSTVVLGATTLLSSGDTDAQQRWLPRIADGGTLATLAHLESTGVWAARPDTSAVRTAHGWELTGVKDFVLDGAAADLLVVSARTESGTSLFLVSHDADGLVRTPTATLDPTRRHARVELNGTAGQLLGLDGGGPAVLGHVYDVAVACLAMEQVGVAQRALDMAVEYAKERHQFGRPIGSFQAIKHKCADMLVRVESARSAAYYASWAAGHDPASLPLAAAMAGSYCSDACFAVAAECVQVHGGIGFTWEHSAQLYFKRAKSSQLLFGTPAEHRRTVAEFLNLKSA